MTTTYYASSKREPALLLRRIENASGTVDEAYLDGAWQPTKIITDYLFGHNDFVDEITDAQARDLEPAAI